ncbi:MAG: SusC/RagA family TonB-linked outer membrane protein, partial [Balneolaceae bacterium]|nr:SusC/RagA family TonB-linked outer membrane protein [Balneolaceae bacterium]
MTPYLRILFILFSVMILVNSGYAQQIEGIVTDANSGEILPGVNVIIKGTSQGTATGMDGSYSLNVPSLQDTLMFSFIGYQPQEIPINGRTEIDVELQQQVISGDELVVVGYGTRSAETLTGSISSVSGEEVSISPSTNVTTSLAGKLPGLVVNQRTGWPGDEQLDILIRGNATFDTDPNDGINTNEPLVVIDGVPRGNLSQLNPDDVESITVLKDASAAIYGARAANGVILVTTKEGTPSDGPQFSFESSYAVHEPTKLPEMMDAALFAQVYNEAEWYRQGRPDMSSFSPFYSDEAIQKYRDGTDPVLYPNTDWPAETMKSSYQSKISLQASGGSENVSYLLSFAYTGQDGNFKNNPTRYKQYNARARVDADLTDDLSVTANINAVINENYRPATGVDFVGLLQSNPTLAAVYPNGLIAPGRFRDNPLLANRRGTDETYDYPIYATFSARYDIPLIEGLALDASYNYDLRNEFQKDFQTKYYWHEYNNQTQEYDRMQSSEPITLEDNYRRWQSSLFNARLSYRTSIGLDHNISTMVGMEQQKDKFSWSRVYRKNFVSQAIPQINVGSSDPEDQETGGGASEGAYNNFFGRFNYDYQSKYLFEFVFRYDGSQNFPEGNRYGFFPAVSAGWRLSQEDFISDNLPFVNELKLRGSYGEIGNDRVPQYQYLQAFQFGNNYVFGGSDQPAIYSSTLPNPNITWEVSKKLDVGLVTELWDGLLGADVTVFRENRSNILLARNLSVSEIFGFPSLPDENI